VNTVFYSCAITALNRVPNWSEAYRVLRWPRLTQRTIRSRYWLGLECRLVWAMTFAVTEYGAVRPFCCAQNNHIWVTRAVSRPRPWSRGVHLCSPLQLGSCDKYSYTPYCKKSRPTSMRSFRDVCWLSSIGSINSASVSRWYWDCASPPATRFMPLGGSA